MWKFKVILLIYVIVSLNSFCLCYERQNVEIAAINRTQRASGSWIFIDRDEDTDARFTRPPRPTPAPIVDPNPCNRKLPDKPNFNVPGRRISEAKCEEFQWDIKRQEEEIKKSEACTQYIKDNNLGNLFGPAVVGGRITEPGEFPHMGALGWKAVVGDWKFQCGCSIISKKFALTAAHCSSVSSRDPTVTNTKPEIIRFRVRNLQKWSANTIPNDADILQVIVHPEYASPKKYFDIALVELKYEYYFGDNLLQPACLWTRADTSPLGKQALVTGWGYLDAERRVLASEMQVAEVNIIDSFQCDMLLKPIWNRLFRGLQPHQICAGVLRGGVDACQGDSGGPLQVKIPPKKQLSYIIGVTSFGHGCARANSPGVYTRVSSFIDWIESIVWP